MWRERVRWGVIEDARIRQRRQRRIAAIALGVSIGVAALLLAIVDGSGGTGSAPGLTIGTRPTAGGARAASRPAGTLVGCVLRAARPRALEGAPSSTLLATLGVLRRPATTADALPPGVEQRMLSRRSFIGGIFVNDIRRAGVIDGRTVWVIPELVLPPCRPGAGTDIAVTYEVPHNTATSPGGGPPAEIRAAENPGTRSGFSHSTGTMLLPNGVATVVLHYPPGRIGASNRHHASATTITAKVVGNVIVVTVPRAGYRLFAPMTMTWLTANGTMLKTFNQLR